MTTNISTYINYDFSSNSTFNMLQKDGYAVYADGEKVKHFLRFNSSNINLTDTITQIKVSFQAKIESTKKPSINLGMCLAEYNRASSTAFVAFGSGSNSTGADATQSAATQYTQCKTSVDISSTNWTSYELYLQIPNNLLAGMLYYGVTDSLRHSHHLGIAIGVKNNGSTSNIIQMSGLSVSVIHNTTSPTPTRTLTVITSPSAGGSVSGGGTYNYASPATLIATPASNYTFNGWVRDGIVVSHSSTYTINAVQLNETYLADFSENVVTPTSYYISASARPSQGGTVTGTGSYTSGSTATLTATASSGYRFTNWTENGSVVSTNSSYSFTVSSARTLVANFEATTTSYYISTSVYPTSGGYTSGSGYYNSGTVATISATSYSGYKFVNWTENGSVVSTNSSYSFTVSKARTLVANFETVTLENTLYLGSNGPFHLPASGLGTYPTFNQSNCLKLKFIPNSTGTYTFSSTQSGSITTDPEAKLFNADGSKSYGLGSDENSNRQFKFTSNELTKGNTYYLMVGNWRSYSEANDFYVKVEQASVTPDSYTITAQSNNTSYGTVSDSGGTYSYGSTFTSTATPKTNCQFDGWYKDGSCVSTAQTLSVTVSGNATYTAQFSSRKQYTITYSDGTSTLSEQKFYAGDSVKLAPAIQKNSTTTNPSYDFSTNFYKQSGTWANGSTSINQIVYPKRKTSYTFYRWRNGSTDYQAEGSYQLSGDITLTAIWNQSHSYTITAPAVSRNDSTVSRTITFHYNDETNKTTTTTSSNTTSYTLKGWYTSTSGGDKKISSNGGSYYPTSGETLYAQWDSSSTGYSKVTFPKFSREGYTLLGFATSSTATSKEYEAGQEVAVNSVDWYAVWSLDTFTLSYDADGGSGSFSDQTGNITYTISSTRPKRTGYNFQGWSLTKGAKTADYYPGGTITISKNTTLYAVWTQETISSKTSKDTTISYAGQIYWYKFTPTTAGEYVMYSTGSSDTYGYIYNSSGTSLDVDDDEGDSTNFRVSYSLSANTPYYFGVKYLSSSSTGTIRINLGPVYTISYNNNGGGTAPNSQSKDWNKSITLSSSTLTRDYYNFKGWSTTASDTEPDYNKGAAFSTDANTILYAVWDPIDYSIEYKLNGGKVAVTNLTSYNVETNSFTLNNPTKDGYTFTGWSGTGLTGTNNKNVTITKGSNGDRTYTANWTQNIYTVTLDNQSANTAGTTAIYLKYNSGWFSNNQATTSISKITIPQKNGYTFNGYYPQKDGAGGNPIIDANGNINFNSTSLLEDKTYYAYWTINYYSLTDNINTNGIENTYNGNYYSITQISGNKVNNKYSYGSKIRLTAVPNTEEGYNFAYWKINNSYESSQECVYTIEKDTTITAYFNLGELSITINLYQEGNLNIFNIPTGQEKDCVKLWIREYNSASHDGWEQKPFNTKLSYEEAKDIQIVIEDGEKYEFLSSSDFTQYEKITINQALVYSVYFKKIPEINSIYFGKSDKPYTSGYIDDPNLSFKEEISSIWVGGEQIMGKAPKRDYPYLEDTLLGNTLYIGKNTSFISDSTKNYRNNLNIYKVIIPEGRVNTGLGFLNCSNLTSVVLPKSLTTLGVYAFRGTNLKSLYLPKNIEDLKYQALCNMQNLEKIIFSNNLKIINEDNLTNSKITTMNFLKTNLETIGSYAFRRIPDLTTVLLPNTLITIEDNAFYNDSSLIKVIYNGTIEQWNNIDIDPTGNEYLLNATIYCKDGVL